jgi:glycosyltransferase involved in cell wall biosynthesis
MNSLIRNKKKKVIIGIDASRCKSGGAIAYIIGLLSTVRLSDHDTHLVHLWSYDDLLRKIEEYPWLVKHTVQETSKNLFFQLLWQRFCLHSIAKSLGVTVMLNPDAGSLCKFNPSVTVSQDMLSFERGEISRYPLYSLEYWRLLTLKYIQLFRFSKSNAVIFLSHHAMSVISKQFSARIRRVLIPHGINVDFLSKKFNHKLLNLNSSINLIYVSNVDLYKHQWNVIEAVYRARKKLRKDIRLHFVGSYEGLGKKRFFESVLKFDPNFSFINLYNKIPNEKIPEKILSSDIFIFASSCENLPITLLEAMAIGIPIISSNRGPMKEVLKDSVIYFDPELPNSIYKAIKDAIMNNKKRIKSAKATKRLSKFYNWKKTSFKTFKILKEVSQRNIEI